MSITETRATPTAATQHWCILTCEYPPLDGGVSDHTFLLARALAAAGDTVEVWCPPAPDDTPDAPDAPPLPNVTVHRLSSHFGIGALRTLRRALRDLPTGARLLVEWVPTAYGWRMMNVPLALILFGLPGRRLELFVHEVGWEISSRETLRRATVGIVHRLMTWLAARSARHVYVTIPAWSTKLTLLGIRALEAEQDTIWTPIPSNLPEHPDAVRVADIRKSLLVGPRRRAVIGHFGTFGRFHMTIMYVAVARILDEGSDRVMLLVGRGGNALRDELLLARPDLASRIVATGGLPPDEASAHLAACDVLVQPYEDGVSARRGSLMAGLALGKATISNRGWNTEEIWAAERAVHLTDSAAPHALAAAVTKLMSESALRDRLGVAAQRLHEERFALRHSVAALRDPPVPTAVTE